MSALRAGKGWTVRKTRRSRWVLLIVQHQTQSGLDPALKAIALSQTLDCASVQCCTLASDFELHHAPVACDMARCGKI